MAQRQLSVAPDVSINVGRWRADGGLGHHSLLLARSLNALFSESLYILLILTIAKATYSRPVS